MSEIKFIEHDGKKSGSGGGGNGGPYAYSKLVPGGGGPYAYSKLEPK